MKSSVGPCLVLLGALIAWAPLAGQESPPAPASPSAGAAAPHRPRIGLALSGGGARGEAHVGVLRALEEQHIPVDVIAGTSAGAIVGGLYAIGLSPDDMARLFRKIDWNKVFTDQAPYHDLPFRRKEERRTYPPVFEFGIRKDGIILPRGFLSGQKQSVLLETFTLRAAGEEDFDRFPIPFRAVATDIVAGEPVILSRGSLSQAILASMSVPGAFAPVDIGGRLLADGGLVDNLPVDVAKAMGADVVIAVNIATPLADRSQLKSVLQISKQAINISMDRNVRENLKLANVVIQPDLSGISAAKFNEVDEIIQRGYEAGRAMADTLKAYAMPEEAYARRLAVLRGWEEPPATPRPLDFVRLEGITRGNVQTLLNRIQTKPGRPLDPKVLERDLDLINGTGDFQSVTYRAVVEGSKEGIIIQAKEKSWGPNYLLAALNVEDDFEGNGYTDLRVRLDVRPANRLGAEWRNDVEVGRRRRLFSEFYQPLGFYGQWFVAPSLDWDNTIENVYEGQRKAAEYSVHSFVAGLDLGAQLGLAGEFRVGLRRGNTRANVSAGSADYPDLDFRVAAVSARLALDSTDNPYFPRKGSTLTLQGFFARKGLGSETSYDKVQAFWSGYASQGPNTWFLHLNAGSSLGSDVPVYDWFETGGLLNFSGYRLGQLRGPYMGLARLGYYRRIGHLSPGLGGGLYAGLWQEAGNVWTRSRDMSWTGLRFSTTLMVGADTFLGPVYLAFSKAPRNQGILYLTVGRRF